MKDISLPLNRPQGSQPVTAAAEIVFHLVHGTFARGAGWTEPDSPLCRNLWRMCGGRCRYERFLWSGENSHEARISAGAALADQLETSLADHPTAKHVVVAHSHGGNVTLYATRHQVVASGLAGIVCLATPFIRATARRPVLPYLAILSAMPAALLLTGLGVASFWGAIKAAGYERAWFFGIGLVLTVLAVCYAYKYIRDGLEIARATRAQAAAIVDAIAVPAAYATPILCVRAVGDEARNWLVGLQWTTVLMRLLYLGFTCFVVVFALAMAISGGPASYGGVILLLLIGFGIRNGLMWIIRGTRAGFGGERFGYYTRSNIWASTWLPRARNITRSWHLIWATGLAHSAIYNDERVLDAVTAWLRSHNIVRSSSSAVDQRTEPKMGS